MLSYNVADLLRSSPGTSQRITIEQPLLEIAEDVELAGPVVGEVRLQNSGRSILVSGHLDTALREQCSRCLRPAIAAVSVDLDEEVLPSFDVETGAALDTGDEPEAMRLDDHHELDLEPAVREAISLAEPIAPLCRPDCPGLCGTCGADLASQPGHAHEQEIDPRLSGLAAIRERLN